MNHRGAANLHRDNKTPVPDEINTIYHAVFFEASKYLSDAEIYDRLVRIWGNWGCQSELLNIAPRQVDDDINKPETADVVRLENEVIEV